MIDTTQNAHWIKNARIVFLMSLGLIAAWIFNIEVLGPHMHGAAVAQAAHDVAARNTAAASRVPDRYVSEPYIPLANQFGRYLTNIECIKITRYPSGGGRPKVSYAPDPDGPLTPDAWDICSYGHEYPSQPAHLKNMPASSFATTVTDPNDPMEVADAKIIKDREGETSNSVVPLVQP